MRTNLVFSRQAGTRK